MKLSLFEESRQGGRARNEDRTACCRTPATLLMVVADGMGGHAGGEVAAGIAVHTFVSRFRAAGPSRLPDPFRFLEEGLGAAHRAILAHAARHGLPASPRTTCVACLVQDGVAYWAHAGDSRLYLLRQGRVAARTRDHSRVRLLLDAGHITEDQAASHPERNRIYSCLGGPGRPEIDFSRKTLLEQGDVLLLCTDGLWDTLPGEAMARAVQEPPLAASLPALLSEAERRAGRHGDNLSVVAARWEESHNKESCDIEQRRDTASAPAPKPVTAPGGGSFPGEAIEQAIEEIRAAIDQYKTRK